METTKYNNIELRKIGDTKAEKGNVIELRKSNNIESVKSDNIELIKSRSRKINNMSLENTMIQRQQKVVK